MNHKHGNVQGKNIIAGIGLGTMVGVFFMLTGVTIVSLLLSNERIAEDAIGYGVLITLITTAIAANGIAVRITGQYTLPVSIGASLSLMIILLGINALFFDGGYEGVGVTFLTVLGVGIGIALIELKRQSKPKKYHKKL